MTPLFARFPKILRMSPIFLKVSHCFVSICQTFKSMAAKNSLYYILCYDVQDQGIPSFSWAFAFENKSGSSIWVPIEYFSRSSLRSSKQSNNMLLKAAVKYHCVDLLGLFQPDFPRDILPSSQSAHPSFLGLLSSKMPCVFFATLLFKREHRIALLYISIFSRTI